MVEACEEFRMSRREHAGSLIDMGEISAHIYKDISPISVWEYLSFPNLLRGPSFTERPHTMGVSYPHSPWLSAQLCAPKHALTNASLLTQTNTRQQKTLAHELDITTKSPKSQLFKDVQIPYTVLKKWRLLRFWRYV